MKKILIVDDDPNIRAMLTRMLSTNTSKTATADSLNQAVSVLRAIRFDIAVIDLSLSRDGDLAGLDVVRFLSLNSPATRVIIFSGSRFDERILSQERLSAVVLKKPQDLARLKSLCLDDSCGCE